MDDTQDYPQHPQHLQHHYITSQPPPVHEKPSIFNQLDNKTVYIILFVVFLLGFFVGKTMMQPVIIKTMGTV